MGNFSIKRRDIGRPRAGEIINFPFQDIDKPIKFPQARLITHALPKQRL